MASSARSGRSVRSMAVDASPGRTPAAPGFRAHHRPRTSPPIRMMNADTTITKNTRTKRGAARDRRTGADVAADQVAGAHHQPDLPQHGALGHEDAERGEVGRPVREPGLGRRLEEAVAEQPDQGDHEEAAGAGAERAVVEADRQPRAHRRARVPDAAEAQRRRLPEGRPEEHVAADHDQHHEHDRVERRRRRCGSRRTRRRPSRRRRRPSAARRSADRVGSGGSTSRC